MSDNSEEDEFLPEKPVGVIGKEWTPQKEGRKDVPLEFDFTTILDDNDTKPVYQKDGFICSKCGEKKYFLITH